MAGNFNFDLAVTVRNARDKEIAAALATVGMEDLSYGFLPWSKQWLRYGYMWIMLHRGWKMRCQTNYILVTDCRMLQKMLAWDTWHKSDHYLVLGYFHASNPT